MRHLATVQTISELHPIPDADRIEVAKVLGWHVVVEKGLYKVGDKCIYCEVDSLFPKDDERFAFLESCNWRIKTRRLRGQISQGICFPLDILPHSLGFEWAEDGTDVSEVLGVTKYEPPIPACIGGDVVGAFPGFIPKTDETRVQVLQDALDRYAGTEAVYTEKLDGTSCTMFFRDEEFGVCSRNLQLKESGDSSLWQMARKYRVEEILRGLSYDIALQGEVIGDGIQGNKYKLAKNERRFYVFNIFDIDSYSYWNHTDVAKFCNNYGLMMVPTVGTMKLTSDIDTLVEMSKGFSVLNPKVRREGIVIRPLNELNDMALGRVSFKAINPEFLLKYGDD